MARRYESANHLDQERCVQAKQNQAICRHQRRRQAPVFAQRNVTKAQCGEGHGGEVDGRLQRLEHAERNI